MCATKKIPQHTGFCRSSKKHHVRTATQDPRQLFAPGSRVCRISGKERQQRQPSTTLPLNGDLVCWWREGQGPKDRRRFSRVFDRKASEEAGAGMREWTRLRSDTDPPRLRLVLEVKSTSLMRCVGSRSGVRGVALADAIYRSQAARLR